MVLAKNQKWRDENRGAVLAGKRSWYERVKTTTEYQEQSRAHREANKAAKQEYDRKYRASQDPQFALDRAKAWREANPEKRAAISMNYKCRRRAWLEGGPTGAELAAWIAAQEKVCTYCSSECANEFHVDHFMPLAKGGAHALENLRISCPPCNRKKNAKLPDQWLAELAEAA